VWRAASRQNVSSKRRSKHGYEEKAGEGQKGIAGQVAAAYSAVGLQKERQMAAKAIKKSPNQKLHAKPLSPLKTLKTLKMTASAIPVEGISGESKDPPPPKPIEVF
jgi:hypothetical protein